MTMTKARELKKPWEFRRPAETLTSGQIGNLFGVAPRTVCKWIDKGLLRSYTIPGSRDRRVTRPEAIRFAVENKISHVLTALRVVLEPIAVSVEVSPRSLPSPTPGWLVPVASPVDAALQLVTRDVWVLVVDASVGRSASLNLARIATDAAGRWGVTPWLAVWDADGSAEPIAGWDVLRPGCDWAKIGERLAGMAVTA